MTRYHHSLVTASESLLIRVRPCSWLRRQKKAPSSRLVPVPRPLVPPSMMQENKLRDSVTAW